VDPIGWQGQTAKDREQTQFLWKQSRQVETYVERSQIEVWQNERVDQPTLDDVRERLREQSVRRARKDPPFAEILSAKSLNDLLVDCQMPELFASEGPTISLTEEDLSKIQVIAAGTRGCPGLLRERRLSWPSLLRRDGVQEERRQLEDLLAKAAWQVARGEDACKKFQHIETALEELEKKLLAVVRIDTCTPNEYLEAKRFLRDYKTAVKLLQSHEVDKYLDGTYSARGKTVAELVKHMTARGLRFAPALDGDEAAYVALHRSLAWYNSALRDGGSRGYEGAQTPKRIER
jgi:hypothetical protein